MSLKMKLVLVLGKHPEISPLCYPENLSVEEPLNNKQGSSIFCKSLSVKC